MKKVLFLIMFILLINLLISAQISNDALFEGIEDLDINKVSQALKAGIDPNITKGNFTPIEKLCYDKIIRIYFDIPREERILNEVPKWVDNTVYNILVLLVKYGAYIDKSRNSIFYSPISFNCIKVTEYLLQYGVNPHGIIMGETITTMSLAVKHHHEETINMLLRYEVKRLSDKDILQLHFTQACYDDDFQEVIKCFNKGAKINEWDIEGRTALMRACYSHNPEITTFLLLKGANPNIPEQDDHFGYPIFQAIFSCSKLLNMTEEWIRIIEIMIEKGAYVSVTDIFGNTPLHWVCNLPEQNVQLAEMLLKANAKVMSKNNDGETPLDLAVSGEMIKLLKSYGATE